MRTDGRQRDNTALTRLRLHEPVFGLMQTLPVPALSELAVWCGLDFVILDCEHGIVDEGEHVACLRAIGGNSAFALVRVKPGSLADVGRYLDFGADGVIMPDVQSAADAAAFVAAATLAPRGVRSSTKSIRAARYGLGVGEESKAAPLLLATIESRQAIDNIAAIAATPGIHGFIVGPSDLSASLGCPYDFSAPAYTDAFVKIEQAAARAQLLIGTIVHPGYPADRLLNAGHRLIIVSADIAVLREGYAARLKEARRFVDGVPSQ